MRLLEMGPMEDTSPETLKEEKETRRISLPKSVIDYVASRPMATLVQEIIVGNAPSDIAFRNQLDLALTWEKELSESEWRLQKKAKNRDRDFNDSLIGAQPRRAILNYDRVKEVIPSEVRSALIDRDVQRMLHIRKLLAEWMTRQAELQERTTRDDGSRLTSSTRSALRKQLRDLEIVIKENMGRVLVNKMSKRMDVLDRKIEEIQARIVRERKKPNPDRASLERMRQRQEKLFAEEQAEVARQQAMWEALPQPI